MIAIPSMDQMPVEFVKSLVNLEKTGDVSVEIISCSLVYQARNDLAKKAIKMGADLVLWLDSDMVFPTHLLKDMLESMKGRDIVAGVCHMRRPPFKPCIFKKLRQGITADENQAEMWLDYPREGVFEIEGCGFGCVAVRTEAIRRVIEKYHEAFSPLPGYGEDLSFCLRARGCGYRIYCDPDIQIGHKAATIVTDETFQAYRKQYPEVSHAE